MSLTKEQCEKELENSRYLIATIINQDGFVEYSCDFEQTSIFVTFEQLIKEHFDNPPLKFEELKLEIPYWDNKEKCWCWFETLNEDIKTGVVIHIKNVPLMSAFIFEENRFYRGDVKDDEK